MKYKATIYLKNVDNIYIRLVEETDKFPMGLNSAIGIFITDNHPNIEDFLADGFIPYYFTIRRIKEEKK